MLLLINCVFIFMRFKFLKHTADAKFRAYGSNINEVFENAGIAFFELITNTNNVKCVVKRELNIESEDLKSLLYDYLEELLYLYEVEGLVFSKFNVTINDNSLRAIVCGERLSNKHQLRSNVKAVTYSEMIVTPRMAQVVIDL